MAGITINDNIQTLEKQEWISVNDPACGAGATLVAAANIFHRKKINYQTRVLLTANDIDRVVAQMCYIQLSLEHLDLICEALDCELDELIIRVPNKESSITHTRQGTQKSNDK